MKATRTSFFARGLGSLLALLFLPAGVGGAADGVTVAHFLEWPTPNVVAKMEKDYDKALGVDVTWKSFGTGNDMSAAMASGGVQIAYSQGLIPFIVAVSRGLPLEAVGIAVAYSDADNCVAHEKAGIDRSTAMNFAESLKGKRIATPVGNITHYKLLKTLAYHGLSENDVSIVPVSGGNDAAAAFLSERVDVGCAFGGPLDRMTARGKVLMTGAEQENIGILTFDVVSVTRKFAQEHPDRVVEFLQVTEDANRAFTANPAAHLDAIARGWGMSPDRVESYLGSAGSFSFPTRDQQLSPAWMGGTVQAAAKGAADFFVQQKQMSRALDDYGGAVNTSYLQRVK